MYLGRVLIDAQGEAFDMVGALPGTTSLAAARLTLGYRVVEWQGLTIRGHEFHYSRLTDHDLPTEPARITTARGAEAPVRLYRQGRVWASYVHLYWAENPAFIEQMLSAPNEKD